MSNKVHTVVSGDTFVKLSTRYYGTFQKWNQIVNANPQLQGRKTNRDGSPVIYPGDVLIIPQDVINDLSVTKQDPKFLDELSPDDISIMIDGNLYTGFTGYTLQLSLDGLDAFSFSAVYDGTDKVLNKIFTPFAFKQVGVYFNRKLVFSGTLLTPTPEVTPDSKTITIQGYPICGVLNDCNIPVSKYPPSYSGMTLSDIASDICEPFNIKVNFDAPAGEAFEKVEVEPTDKILDLLKKLAEQRNLLFTNDSKGMLKFYKVKSESVSATFKEGELPFISCKPNFKSQEMFSHITGFTKTDKEDDSSQFTYENDFLIKKGVFRPVSYVISDATSGNLEECVKVKAGQMMANCVSYELTVVGCTDSKGELFHKGMCIALTAPGAEIYKETKLQVRTLNIKRSDTEGVQTTMELVLPESFTGSIPKVMPWD